MLSVDSNNYFERPEMVRNDNLRHNLEQKFE